MTIEEVVQSLQKEKQESLPSRYPCRAIMVSNVRQYCSLISELKKISDIRMVSSSELFTSPDVLPKYDVLKNSSFRNEWVILTGVSEYLRLFSKKEASGRRFGSLWGYQAPASSTGRIIIPLWGCEAQWFDDTLNLNGDLRQQDFYYDCTDPDAPEQDMELLVLSDMFEKYLTRLRSVRANLRIGLQEWFEYWEAPFADNLKFVLLTKRCNSITTMSGRISIHVVKDTLSFIRENMPGAQNLDEDICSEDMQSALFEYALEGQNLDCSILAILNMVTFVGTDVMRKWGSMNNGQKELAALWIKNHPDHSYLHHCVMLAENVAELPYVIGHEILRVYSNNPQWVDEYKELTQAMQLVPDQAFFRSVENIPEYENRLDFMSSSTREGRIMILKTVGQWLSKDPQQVSSSQKLETVYPELAAYLFCDVEELKNNIGSYIYSYKKYKLSNRLPKDENLYFNGVQTDQQMSRYSVLSEYVIDNTVVLWIDALGIEWVSLLKWAIEHGCGDCTVQRIAVTQATLPTETCYNDQWNSMDVPHVKLDKLDKLAHKGVIDEPDYYSCIEDQLTFVVNIAKHICSLMDQYHRVIITGDHGTSRLAARFFHERDGITAPADAEVGGHGRFCKLSAGGSSIALPQLQSKKGSNGEYYAVFSNYDHFKRSGFAAGGDDDNAIFGEVHGGAAPEEMLVPVVVVDSNQEIPLTANWESNTTKILMKKAKFNLDFSKVVNSLIVKIGNVTAETVRQSDGMKWNITFTGIKHGIYHVDVYADNHSVHVPDVTIKPALGGGIGDLP